MRPRSAPRMVLSAAALLALVPGVAQARSQLEMGWTAHDVFPVAVRFVRVDRGCRVTDVDERNGYITFECEIEGAPREIVRDKDGHEHERRAVKRGALELIPVASAERDGVRVQLTLGDEPRYMELRFLERFLERKVRDERGPAPPPRPPAQAPGPDAGTGSGP